MRPGDRACTRDSPRVLPFLSGSGSRRGREGRKGEIKKLRKEGKEEEGKGRWGAPKREREGGGWRMRVRGGGITGEGAAEGGGGGG